VTQPNTIKIDEVEYVRKDQARPSRNTAGMDYCIIRSREQGVMCGYVEAINGRSVKLHSARQIWAYDSTFVLPDIAEHGPRNASKMQMSVAMSQPMIMLEACGVLTCTANAAEALRQVPAMKK